MQNLMYSVQALAQPAGVQLGLYPDGSAKVDELALDFDNFWRCAKSDDGERLTAEQIEMLDGLDSELERMSGHENAELWTEEGLRHSPRWERIREDARLALNAFGWPYETPPDEASR